MLTRWQLVLGLSVGMALPTLGNALTVGNIEVQSAVNEPFRAKIPLRNINVPLSSIRTEMASNNDYARLGIDPNLAPNLNFRIQDNGNGTAELLLSSNEPVNANQVDLLISVGARQDKTLHQMSAALKPGRERLGPAINPADPVYTGGDMPLIPTKSAPPPMSVSAPKVELPKVTVAEAVKTQPEVDPVSEKAASTVATYDGPATSDSNDLVSSGDVILDSGSATSAATSRFEQKVVEKVTSKQKPAETAKAVSKPAKKSTAKPTSMRQRANYRVVRRDTLWDIAVRVSREHKLPLNKVMDSIQALNQDAFIRNNPNLLREGVTLTIPRYDEVNELARSVKKATPKKSRAGKASRSGKKAVSARKSSKRSTKATKKRKPRKARKAPVSARKSKKSVQRLKKAEMRIVAPSASGNAQGETKQSRNASGKKLAPQITAQVKKSRSATIQQRKRVNKLNTKLSDYSKKIQLQNAKLAELENRLKQLNKKSKPAG